MANLSQIKRDRMKNFLETLKEANNSDEQIKAINEIENFLDEKRYGLVWEEHEEEVDVKMRNNIPVFTEDESKKIISDSEKPINFLLEGDNLHSLYLLEKTHKGKVDVIYIDPPYNTKKEGFTYDDKKIDGNDGFRHSKWIDFMHKRLSIAKNLLTEEGIIFVSIDENEFAALKLIMDDIFSPDSFVECLIWNKRVPKNDKGIGNIHEYIMMYSRNPDLKKVFMVDKDSVDEIIELVENAKENGMSVKEAEAELKAFYKVNNFPRAITLYNNLDNNYRIFGKINMSWPNGNTEGPRFDVLHPKTHKPVKMPDRGWRWVETTFEQALDNDNVMELHNGSFLSGRIWFAKDENTQASSINYLKDTGKMLLSSIISLKSDGGMELERIFGKKNIFSYPKPTSLIKKLIDSATYASKSGTILDFFAGSSTTGDAVLQLNNEDGGNRNFILATNNEGEIAENIAYQRLLKISKGYAENCEEKRSIFRKKITLSDMNNPALLEKKITQVEKENKGKFDRIIREISDGEYIIYGIINSEQSKVEPLNLKYFKTEFIPRHLGEDESLTDDLLYHIKEMAELEFGVDLETSQAVKMVLDEDELDEFFIDEENTNLTLLIPTFVLLKGQQEYDVEKRNITLIRIPDYYFAVELKEAGEL
jgi:adenine-specific DNA-methyltransferase